MNMSRRRFAKLLGFGAVGAVVANALPSSSEVAQAALPAPSMTGLVEDTAIEGEWLGPETHTHSWEDIHSHNPHHVTKEMIGLGRREDLWAHMWEPQRIMTPEDGGITFLKGPING